MDLLLEHVSCWIPGCQDWLRVISLSLFLGWSLISIASFITWPIYLVALSVMVLPKMMQVYTVCPVSVAKSMLDRLVEHGLETGHSIHYDFITISRHMAFIKKTGHAIVQKVRHQIVWVKALVQSPCNLCGEFYVCSFSGTSFFFSSTLVFCLVTIPNDYISLFPDVCDRHGQPAHLSKPDPYSRICLWPGI